MSDRDLTCLNSGGAWWEGLGDGARPRLSALGWTLREEMRRFLCGGSEVGGGAGQFVLM